VKLNKIRENIYKISRDDYPEMNVPAFLYASDMMMEDIENDQSLTQLKNAAMLPGIANGVYAMPDIHYGYGLPIGGVLPVFADKGVITPGGVGFDINCGVRLITFDINKSELKNPESLVKHLYKKIPCGVGEGGNIKLSNKEMKKLLQEGSKWAVNSGYGNESDLYNTESFGCLSEADPSQVSKRAMERGSDQCGTLGSGNHFLEIGSVDKIFDKKTANFWGFEEGKLTLMIHSGSRGLGHQICTDFLKVFERALEKYKISVPDKQLSCAPVDSDESRKYLSAMACAANFAWANRQILMNLAVSAVADYFKVKAENLNYRLIYDVAHNIVKKEFFDLKSKNCEIYVHRKGATRALPPGHKDLPEHLKKSGQPVIIPGDMGRYSYILSGAKNAPELSFNSACHGAGRVLSRKKAVKTAGDRNIAIELKDKNIYVMSRGKKTLKEEMPDAYKDVANVVDVVHNLKIAEKTARIKPICVIKG